MAKTTANKQEPGLHELADLWPEWFESFLVWLLLALTFGLLTARLSTADALGSANDRSRWCTVWSLAVRGSYRIDEIIQRPGWDTIDKVRHEEHFYSTKPPLYPTCLAGLYWVIKQITGLTLSSHPNEVGRLILLLVNVIPFIVTVYLWWQILVGWGYLPLTRVLMVAITCLATLVTPYLMVLNNHTPAVMCLMLTLSGLFWIAQSEEQAEVNRLSAGLYFWSGFWAAWTCCHEIPAALFSVISFVWLLRKNPQKTAVYFVPAALIPLVGFFVTNLIVTGGIKPFYTYYGTEKYVYEYLGVPSYWSQPQGLDKATDSVPEYLFHCLIGHHGIFSLSPLLLLAVPGCYWGITQREGLHRQIHIWGATLTTIILAFYWSRTENYNYGGNSVALRWVLWLTPFWLLMLAETIDRWRNPRKLLITLILLGVPSLYSVWSCWQTPWQAPWLFNVMSDLKWIDYSDPPPALPKPIHSWLTVMPTAAQRDPDYWIMLRNGEGALLKISDGGPVVVEQQRARIIRMENQDNLGNVLNVRSLVIGIDSFEQSGKPENYLYDWKDSAFTAQRQQVVNFLSGVPGNSAYRPGYFRYLFTSLRENAFRCRRIATRTVTEPTEYQPATEYRCELWLADELPFALAQIQNSQTDLRQNSLVSRVTWTVISAGQLIPSPDKKTETIDAEND